jgi:phosphonate transport system substrate-binding protein
MTRTFLTLLILVAVALPGLAGGDVPEVLRVSAVPDESPKELVRIHAPLAEYLGKALGMKVQFMPVVDHAAAVEGLATRKLDLVWYGGFTSVQAVRRTNGTARRLVLRQEDAATTSVFIARPGSGIKDLADLEGKTFAFGPVSSTSGHLMPRSFLLKAGVSPERDMKIAFSGADGATALWVESGKVEAGALNSLAWDKLVQAGKVDGGKVGVFHTTPPYVDHVWTTRGDLDKGVQDKIAAAFLALDARNPEHKRLLDLHRTRKYVRASDADWKGIEEAATAAGLLK